jgi:hypothetical protein
MARTILTLSTALMVAAGAFVTAAEAGSCGGGGYRGGYSSAPSRSYSQASNQTKAAKTKVSAAKSAVVSKKTAVAQAERELRGSVATTNLAASDPAASDKASAIAEPAVAAVETAVVETADATATAARDLGCKRFIPAAGLTISVACGE